jgi:hypothetical protein
MTTLNQILGRLFDVLFVPLRALPPLLGLAIVALLVAILMLLVFKVTSNQRRIGFAKRRMQAGLFEIRLFQDDLRTILLAQGDILRHNLAYLRLSVVPVLWTIVPLTLLIAQLQSFYGYEALRPGETFLLKMQMQDAPGRRQLPRPDVTLRVPAGLQAEAAVWSPSLGEQAWRIRATRAGRYVAEVHLGGESFAKSVTVADDGVRLSPVRQQPHFWQQLLYPVEAPFRSSQGMQSLHVTYATRLISVFGWQLQWLPVFFLLVLAFALLLKNRFRVSF